MEPSRSGKFAVIYFGSSNYFWSVTHWTFFKKSVAPVLWQLLLRAHSMLSRENISAILRRLGAQQRTSSVDCAGWYWICRKERILIMCAMFATELKRHIWQHLTESALLRSREHHTTEATSKDNSRASVESKSEARGRIDFNRSICTFTSPTEHSLSAYHIITFIGKCKKLMRLYGTLAVLQWTLNALDDCAFGRPLAVFFLIISASLLTIGAVY